MQPLEAFYPDISLSVGNIHTPIIDNAIMGAAIEFCDKTRAWEEPLNNLTIAPGVSDYCLDFDDVTRVIITLKEFTVNGRQIEPESLSNIRRTTNDWRTRVADLPEFYYFSTPTQVTLFPNFTDTASGDMTFVGVFKPHRKSKSLPDFLYNDYYDAITKGAEARLHSMKGRSWYSPNDSVEAKRLFGIDIDEAKIRASKNRTNASFRLRIRGAA